MALKVGAAILALSQLIGAHVVGVSYDRPYAKRIAEQHYTEPLPSPGVIVQDYTVGADCSEPACIQKRTAQKVVYYHKADHSAGHHDHSARHRGKSHDSHRSGSHSHSAKKSYGHGNSIKKSNRNRSGSK